MWEDLIDNFDCSDDPCKFYKEYFSDIELRIGEKKRFENRKKDIFLPGKCLIVDDY